MNVQDITLDISKKHPDTEIVRIGQGDSSGTTIRAMVYDNGQVQSLSGMTATMEMRLPDGKSYASGGSCSISNNVITCIVDEEHFAAVAGYTDEAYFKLVSGTTIYSTSRFRVKVERAASNGADPAQSYSDDIVSATTAARQAANDAREAMEEIGTAVEDAAQAAESAAQAVEDAQTAVEDADTAKREATSAANAATAAANNANSKANAANTAANNANTAANATNSATQRAEAAIAAMGDISEQAVPVMSSDIRGGARIQPDSGLEITDTDSLQVQLALESDGTVRGGIAELTAKGHAEQRTTTGKNLLPNDAVSQTYSGVAFIVNADGSITANGTATESIWFVITPNFTLSAGTYILSGDKNHPSGAYLSDDNTFGADSSRKFTLSTETSGRVYFRIRNGVTVSNLTFYPMLRLASITDDTYEPYTGGAPSPSPEFPQTIEVVRGRNLYDGTRVAGGISADGSISGLGEYSHSNAIAVESGKSYVWSGLSGLLHTKRVHACDANGNWISSIASTIANVGTTYNISFEVPADVHYVMGSFYNSDSQLQLTLGSTPQPYVPYGHVGMEVQGRNLVFGMLNKYLSVSSSSNVWVISSSANTRSALVRVEPNKTYTFSRVGGNRTMIAIVDSDNPTTVVRQIVNDFTLTTHTFTTQSDEQFVMMYVTNDVNTSPVMGVQLELGSTATEYQPYYHTTIPIPLPQRGWVAGLPDGTADSLRLDGAGHVEWTLPLIMFKGSELKDISPNSPSLTTATTGFGGIDTRCAFYLATALFGNSNVFAVSGITQPVLCDRLSYAGEQLYNSNKVGINVYTTNASGNNYLEMRVSDTLLTQYGSDLSTTVNNITAFKAWLADTDLEIIAHVQTPTTEDCGYVDDWPTDIPEGATLSISELDSVGIKYFIDSSVTELAKQWYARANSEYADRITALEQAVAELATS